MADYEDYDSSQYSSEYPNCEPLAANFYLYSYWWLTIIAQVLLIFVMIIIVVIIIVVIILIIIIIFCNIISDPVLLPICDSFGISQQTFCLP